MSPRIRQHVNPLSSKFQQPLMVPDWQQIFANVDLPIHLDIGCARGRFLLEMAKQHSEVNYLGIEIRKQLVNLANQDRDELGLANLHYLFGNMNSSAQVLLKSLPVNNLKTVSVQFPDPWFKKKHNKRRVVQPDLVNVLVDYLAVGGEVFLQSDIKEVVVEMRDRFSANPHLTQKHPEEWLEYNPLSVATERELHVLQQNLPVYRVLLAKSDSSL
ncbi:MAG: tRNA (guanosine(46)-N7)-methyltransferase TrmB [Cyanobacteria bacterium J06621_12]